MLLRKISKYIRFNFEGIEFNVLNVLRIWKQMTNPKDTNKEQN